MELRLQGTRVTGIQPHGQVFISYKREEVNVARRVKEALEDAGYSVWWDKDLQCGQQWHERIDSALGAAHCVVVLWSSLAIESPWVRHEASQAIARKVYAPARIDGVALVSPFDRVQYADLFNWSDESKPVGFDSLLSEVKRLLPKPHERLWKFLRNSAWTIGSLVFATAALSSLYELRRSTEDQIVTLAQIPGPLRAISPRLEATSKAMNNVVENVQGSLTPKLRFNYSLSIGADKGGWFQIENIGAGVAEITDIRFKYKGEAKKTDAKTLATLGKPFNLSAFDLRKGDLVSPGSPVTVYWTPPRYIEPKLVCPEDRARKTFFEDFDLEIDYRSFFGYMATLKLVYESPNKLNC